MIAPLPLHGSCKPGLNRLYLVEDGCNFEHLLHCSGVSLVELLGVDLEPGFDGEQSRDAFDEFDPVVLLVDVV